MKLLFFLLVLLRNGMNPAEGLKVFYSLEYITLSYSFNSYYNGFEIMCCKLVRSQCLLVANSRGQTGFMYVRRVFFRNDNGKFEASIINVRETDAGTYRCGVTRFPQTYEDVYVTVTAFIDRSIVSTAPLLPKPSIKPAVRVSSPSTPSVTERKTEKSSDVWGTSHTLTVVLSVLFAVSSVTLIACHLKFKKKKSSDKSGTFSFPSTNLEQNSVIYSMVDFNPHQNSSEYANVSIRRREDTKEESVEYSVLRTAA